VSIDAALSALAEPHRRKAIELLSQRPRPAGELARDLGLSAPAMSRHLRALRQSGLVEETSPAFDARVKVYALKKEGMNELRVWLDEAERMWAVQLAAFKRHIETAP